MEALSELDLPHLPIKSPEFAADPYPHLAAARMKHAWLATAEAGYVVHEYTAMRELFGQDDKMRVYNDGVVEHMGAGGTSWGRWMTRQIIAMSPEQHRRVRDAFAASFTPRFANDLRPHMRATITRQLDAWAPKGVFDFDEFASWIPISVMFAMIGAPAELVGEIKADLETLGLGFSMDETLAPAVISAFQRVEALVDEVVAERRSNPHAEGTPDLLDLMITASDAGGVTDEELVDLLLAFFIAAYDTTKSVLTTIMRLLIERPDIYRRCAEDRDLCRRTVEETLRHIGPSTALRLTTEDFAFRNVLIPQGTMLFFPYSIAGRDPGAFPDGETFDPDRPADHRHIAFGLGRHMCIGQYIARAQLQEALHLIAQHIQQPKLAGPYGWRPFPGIWGLKELPITFTPA
jgi:cytochrome P450